MKPAEEWSVPWPHQSSHKSLPGCTRSSCLVEVESTRNISFPKKVGLAIFLCNLGKPLTWAVAWVEWHQCELQPGWNGTIVTALWEAAKKHSSYWLGLWSGGKPTDGQSQWSCHPVNGGPKWDLWVLLDCSSCSSTSLWLGHLSELPSQAWGTQGTISDNKAEADSPAHHISTLLRVKPLPVRKCKVWALMIWCEYNDLVWALHWTWGEFLIGAFAPIEIGVHIILPVCLWIDYGMNVTVSNLWLSRFCSEPYWITIVNVKEFND